MGKWLVVTEARGQALVEHSSAEEAIEVATGRVRKNQTNYGGDRKPYRYAICKIEYFVLPQQPDIPVDVIAADEIEEDPDDRPGQGN